MPRRLLFAVATGLLVSVTDEYVVRRQCLFAVATGLLVYWSVTEARLVGFTDEYVVRRAAISLPSEHQLS